MVLSTDERRPETECWGKNNLQNKGHSRERNNFLPDWLGSSVKSQIHGDPRQNESKWNITNHTGAPKGHRHISPIYHCVKHRTFFIKSPRYVCNIFPNVSSPYRVDSNRQKKITFGYKSVLGIDWILRILVLIPIVNCSKKISDSNPDSNSHSTVFNSDL